ncbi:hypothetical protein QJQ45_005968 [Haematococcus lacustris]|nr:hypothetical protein QJQ45_005968 [Haematococcus lacustris]
MCSCIFLRNGSASSLFPEGQYVATSERGERSDAVARSNSEQHKREYVESAPQHQERLAAQMTSLQSVIQTAISEDWQHHACASAFLEALNAAHHPLALYPPQQIRTDSFSQAFLDYLRAIDRLLSMPGLLQQRLDLQAQLPRGAFSDRPICVPQDGCVHCVAGDACNKPSSYAGVAKATHDLEQHTDTYLDRSGLEGAVQQLHDSGQLCLEHLQRPELQQRQQELEQTQRPETSNITAGQPCAVRGVVGFVCCHGVPLLALYCIMRTAEQFVYYLRAWHAACDMLHLYNDFACQFQVPYPGGAAHHNVHELGLQRERMGQSDKDTRAASNAIKAKLRTARQLLKEAALYQALGSGEDAAAVSIIEEQLQAMIVFAPAWRFTNGIINTDGWDGYAASLLLAHHPSCLAHPLLLEAERERILDTIKQHAIDNVVVLTGDVHSSFAMDVPREQFKSGDPN